MTLIKSFFTLAFILTISNAQAQNLSYPEKQAALEEKVQLHFGMWIPEIEKAQAVNELYDLVFESDLDTYFDKKTGLVQRIIVEDISYAGRTPNIERVESKTLLKDHTIIYPTKFSAVELIANRIESEQQTLNDLKDLILDIKSSYPNINLVFDRKAAYSLGTSNLTRKMFLDDLVSVLNSSNQLRHSLRNYSRFDVIDSHDSYGINEFKLWTTKNRENVVFKHASLHVGRHGLDTSMPTLGLEELENILHLGFILNFGVKPGYFTSQSKYSDALEALVQYLNPTNIAHLRDNNVRSFELDEEYARRERLYSHGKLTVGLTEEDIAFVVDFLFPR